MNQRHPPGATATACPAVEAAGDVVGRAPAQGEDGPIRTIVAADASDNELILSCPARSDPDRWSATRRARYPDKLVDELVKNRRVEKLPCGSRCSR